MKRTSLSLIVEHKIAELNSAMTSIASFLGSWLAFLPEAAMASLAFKSILGWGNFLSWLVALSLEFVGHELNGYYQSALEFNAAEELWMKKHGAKNLRYPKENTKLALKLLVIFYIVTGIFVIGTSIFIAVRDADWIKLLVVPLPFATGIGNVITNRAAALHRKKAQIANAKRRDSDATVTQKPKIIATTIADFRDHIASLNGKGASFTQSVALAWAKDRGMDVGNKNIKDKVLRWYRKEFSSEN